MRLPLLWAFALALFAYVEVEVEAKHDFFIPVTMPVFDLPNRTNPAITHADDTKVSIYVATVGGGVLVILMAYSACRYWKVGEKLLTPRTYYSLGPNGLRAHFPRPKYWRKKCFGNWMLVSLLAREDKLLTQAGLDGYIIMRTFRLSFWIVLLLTIPGVCIVLPFYRYGFCNPKQHSSVSYCTQDARTLYCKHLCFNSTLKTENYSAWSEAMKLEDCSCIDLFTSLNIPDTSPALWIPAAMGMYTAVVITWFLWRESREQVCITLTLSLNLTLGMAVYP